MSKVLLDIRDRIATLTLNSPTNFNALDEHMIVTGGENVFSAEVENALANHSDVAMCAVIGIPSEQWGESVHAVIVPKNGKTPAPDDLIDHCKALIAGYKCPKSVEIREALPLSGAGKILKTELREPYWHGQGRRVA